MKLKKKILAGSVALSVVALAFYMRFPPGPRPLCGNLIGGVCQQWMLENHTNAYPNTNGNGSASLGLLTPYFGKTPYLANEDFQRYGYVPGLHPDDPKDLVLMYLKEKTRCTWHGDTSANIFSPKRWKIVSPDIFDGPDPEGGRLVDTPDFKKKMQRTLDFLRENQRPSWQTVSTEQTAFLNSIKE